MSEESTETQSPIYVRRCETWTTTAATKPIKVDVIKLRKCTPPYSGTMNDELMLYLTDEVWKSEDWYERNKETYGDGEAWDLVFVFGSLDEYWDSRNKGCDDWIEVGVPNKILSKRGDFECFEGSNLYS